MASTEKKLLGISLGIARVWRDAERKTGRYFWRVHVSPSKSVTSRSSVAVRAYELKNSSSERVLLALLEFGRYRRR